MTFTHSSLNRLHLRVSTQEGIGTCRIRHFASQRLTCRRLDLLHEGVGGFLALSERLWAAAACAAACWARSFKFWADACDAQTRTSSSTRLFAAIIALKLAYKLEGALHCDVCKSMLTSWEPMILRVTTSVRHRSRGKHAQRMGCNRSPGSLLNTVYCVSHPFKVSIYLPHFASSPSSCFSPTAPDRHRVVLGSQQ